MPLSRTIVKGDRVRLKARALATYRTVAPDVTEETVFSVVGIQRHGRKSLIVDVSPSMIWNRDVNLAWEPNCEERLRALGVID